MNRRVVVCCSVVAVFVVASAATVGCSSEDSPSTTTSALDSGSDALVIGIEAGPSGDPDNCVKPGTKNNDQGVGGYCETNDDCLKGKTICTKVFGAPAHAWFCTRPCQEEPDCGAGLYCAQDPRGVACVPIVCGVADAGADAGADATAVVDASTD